MRSLPAHVGVAYYQKRTQPFLFAFIFAMDAAAVTALAAVVNHDHASALMQLLQENMELRQQLEQQRQQIEQLLRQRQELEELVQELDDASVPVQWQQQWHHAEDPSDWL